MKISPTLAGMVAQNRHQYLNELALYLDMPVHEAINTAVVEYKNHSSLLSGVAIPDGFTPLTFNKVKMISDGSHQCRAYLAQVALDICLKEGFCPSKNEDLLLLSCMLLVRFSVTSIDNAYELIPSSWSDEQSNRLKVTLNEVGRGGNVN